MVAQKGVAKVLTPQPSGTIRAIECKESRWGLHRERVWSLSFHGRPLKRFRQTKRIAILKRYFTIHCSGKTRRALAPPTPAHIGTLSGGAGPESSEGPRLASGGTTRTLGQALGTSLRPLRLLTAQSLQGRLVADHESRTLHLDNLALLPVGKNSGDRFTRSTDHLRDFLVR